MENACNRFGAHIRSLEKRLKDGTRARQHNFNALRRILWVFWQQTKSWFSRTYSHIASASSIAIVVSSTGNYVLKFHRARYHTIQQFCVRSRSVMHMHAAKVKIAQSNTATRGILSRSSKLARRRPAISTVADTKDSASTLCST